MKYTNQLTLLFAVLLGVTAAGLASASNSHSIDNPGCLHSVEAQEHCTSPSPSTSSSPSPSVSPSVSPSASPSSSPSVSPSPSPSVKPTTLSATATPATLPATGGTGTNHPRR